MVLRPMWAGWLGGTVAGMKKRIAGLLLLSAVPFVAGVARLVSMSTGAFTLEDGSRFAADPLPAALHIVGATAFFTIGAFQFVPSLRQGAWHRRAGRVLSVLGVGAALAGMWMVWRWPPKQWDSPLLGALRVVVACAIIVAIAVSVSAARRGDLWTHQAWMTRAYALWAGAGTQVFTFALFDAPPLEPVRGEGLYAALMAAGWLVNLGVAEWSLARAPLRKAVMG